MVLALPRERAPLLLEIVDRLREIPGIAAIVLGGSYARRVSHEGSDLDIGLYYSPEAPFEIPAIRRVGQSFAIPTSLPVITDFYEWGPWVNGGAWIQTRAGRVDFLHRNLVQVEQVIEDAQGPDGARLRSADALWLQKCNLSCGNEDLRAAPRPAGMRRAIEAPCRDVSSRIEATDRSIQLMGRGEGEQLLCRSPRI